MWRLDEDPAQGIPDAGFALRGTHLCHSLGVYGYLLYTRRRHRGRHGFGACGDALGGLVGVLNLGYPLWLLLAVLVVLTFYVLRGRVSDRMLWPLTVVLAPVSAVLVVAIAVLISSLLSPLYEAPTDTATNKPQKAPATTPEPTVPETTAPAASPTASPSVSPSATPSASPSASPSAVPSASATASASAAP